MQTSSSSRAGCAPRTPSTCFPPRVNPSALLQPHILGPVGTWRGARTASASSPLARAERSTCPPSLSHVPIIDVVAGHPPPLSRLGDVFRGFPALIRWVKSPVSPRPSSPATSRYSPPLSTAHIYPYTTANTRTAPHPLQQNNPTHPPTFPPTTTIARCSPLVPTASSPVVRTSPLACWFEGPSLRSEHATLRTPPPPQSPRASLFRFESFSLSRSQCAKS